MGLSKKALSSLTKDRVSVAQEEMILELRKDLTKV